MSTYSIKLELSNFTLLFRRVRQRNVPEVITHVQIIGLLIKPCCFVVSLVPEPYGRIRSGSSCLKSLAAQ